jgi:hypothetical protein
MLSVQWSIKPDAGFFWCNVAYQRRLELIQHFDFPTAGSRLKLTPDQNFLIATGMLWDQNLNQILSFLDRELTPF